MQTVAIVGLPSSGKSAVFTAVSGQPSAPGTSSLAVVAVPDERLATLAKVCGAAKTTPVQVELVDVPSLDAHSLGSVRAADALVVVLRAFGPDADPSRDLGALRADLATADLGTVEKVRERATKQARVAGGDKAAQLEADASERAEAVLLEGRMLGEAEWTPEERRAVSLWTPLTMKPVLHVVNTDEGDDTRGVAEPVVVVHGLLECEAADLPPDEAAALLEEFGVAERATPALMRGLFAAMDLITFYTGNEREARAWAVERGTKAPRAAGAIHTAFEKGFIRAERISFDDFVAAGSYKSARERGQMRVEGKDYVVQDGDYLSILHS
jgi:hypothetical protein